MAERKTRKKPDNINIYGFRYTGNFYKDIVDSFKDVDPFLTGKRKSSSMWTPYKEYAESDVGDELSGSNPMINPSHNYDFRNQATVKYVRGRKDEFGERKVIPKSVTFKKYKRYQEEGLEDPVGDLVEKKTVKVEVSSDKE